MLNSSIIFFFNYITSQKFIHDDILINWNYIYTIKIYNVIQLREKLSQLFIDEDRPQKKEIYEIKLNLINQKRNLIKSKKHNEMKKLLEILILKIFIKKHKKNMKRIYEIDKFDGSIILQNVNRIDQITIICKRDYRTIKQEMEYKIENLSQDIMNEKRDK
ncbi:unnamed protein product [Paramecium pentaurelia]|uniref:Uncharacterized protein n=1 Tax=Paramecium pentaurelia TaxID=43138 RepID=A0A8S1U5U0_9CILI|nr:unnamed protein product [Paramecium pentaurelia]